MSQRIAPSERIEQAMSAFLQQGIHSSEQPLSQFIRLAVPQVRENEVRSAVRAIWDAPNRATADLLVRDFIA